MRAINTFLTLKILANCQMSTGSLMTRQTYERAPRLTKLATAHISKGDYVPCKKLHRSEKRTMRFHGNENPHYKVWGVFPYFNVIYLDS